MTLKSTFKKIYAELLCKYGYEYCAKLDRFVKVVNQEFIHCIGLTAKGYIAHTSGYKAFSITGTIVSIYYQHIEKTELNSIARHLYSYYPSKETIQGFKYNEESMEEALLKSFTYVEQYMLPVMEKVIDYDSYIHYQIRKNSELLSFANRFWLDSLVLIVTDNHDDFMDVVDENYSKQREEDKTQLLYDAMCRAITEHITRPRDGVFQSPELLSMALEEAKRQKEHNIAKLQAYKVNYVTVQSSER